MAKIDIISLSGLTAEDGSIVASGATIKFETIFFIGTSNIEIRPRVFRSRELFENGFKSVRVLELPTDFVLAVSDDEYYVITPQRVYELVNEYLNTLLGENMFEIKIIV